MLPVSPPGAPRRAAWHRRCPKITRKKTARTELMIFGLRNRRKRKGTGSDRTH